jgi:hypothetical protein
MRRLIATVLAATALCLPTAPANAGPGASLQRNTGPDVELTASLDCSEQELVFWFVLQNSGPTALHIDGMVHGALRMPPRVLKFSLAPAPGWDVIEPGGEVRFGIPAWVLDPPFSSFDAERIIFGIDVQFEETKLPLVRHTVVPGCS